MLFVINCNRLPLRPQVSYLLVFYLCWCASVLMLWAGEGPWTERWGLGRARAEPRKGGQPPGPGWGLVWGSESSIHRVPPHRNSILPQPSAEGELQFAYHGAEGQLLPLGLETPIPAAVQFGPELGVHPEAVCCNFSGHCEVPAARCLCLCPCDSVTIRPPLRLHASHESGQHPRETGGKPRSPAQGPTPCGLSLGEETTLEVLQYFRLWLCPSEQPGPWSQAARARWDDRPTGHAPKLLSYLWSSPTHPRNPLQGPQADTLQPSLGDGPHPSVDGTLPRKSRLDTTSRPLPSFPDSIKPGRQSKILSVRLLVISPARVKPSWSRLS